MKVASARNYHVTVLLAVFSASLLLQGVPTNTLAAEAAPDRVGRVCLAPVSDPVAQPEELRPEVDYAATDLPPRKVSAEAGSNGEIIASRKWARSLGPIPFGEQQLIKVWADGAMVQAFLVDFAELPEPRLCLTYREARESWALLPASKAGEWCYCDHGAYVPPAPPSDEEAEVEQGIQ